MRPTKGTKEASPASRGVNPHRRLESGVCGERTFLPERVGADTAGFGFAVVPAELRWVLEEDLTPPREPGWVGNRRWWVNWERNHGIRE